MKAGLMTTRHGVSKSSRKFPGGTRYLEISEDANVLVVEDSLERVTRFKSWLPQARIVASASRAIEATRKNSPEIIFLDRDLVGPSFGEDVAAFLVASDFAGKVYVTSANPFGVELISKALADAGINYETIPFVMLAVVRIPAQRGTR